MTDDNLVMFGIIALVAFIAVSGNGLQAVVLAPNDFTPENYCNVDGSQYFSAEPSAVLVNMQDWSPTVMLATFEGQEFTPSQLVTATKNYISKYCTPIDNDYCVNQKMRAGTDYPVAVSASIFVRNDGVYFDNYKILKSDQKFRTIVLSQHPEITSELGYNRQYVGNLYGTSDAYNFKCTANYGITNPTTTTTTSTTTTTITGGFNPTTTTMGGGSGGNPLFDLISGIINWFKEIFGLDNNALTFSVAPK